MESKVKEEVYNGVRLIDFYYYNKKKLGFCFFIEEIKEDLLKHISKNRGFILNENIIFLIDYTDYKYFLGHIIDEFDIIFGVNGICVKKFVKDLLNCANEYYKKIY